MCCTFTAFTSTGDESGCGEEVSVGVIAVTNKSPRCDSLVFLVIFGHLVKHQYEHRVTEATWAAASEENAHNLRHVLTLGKWVCYIILFISLRKLRIAESVVEDCELCQAMNFY